MRSFVTSADAAADGLTDATAREVLTGEALATAPVDGEAARDGAGATNPDDGLATADGEALTATEGDALSAGAGVGLGAAAGAGGWLGICGAAAVHAALDMMRLNPIAKHFNRPMQRATQVTDHAPPIQAKRGRT